MNYAIIGDEDAVMGFGIVGIQGRVAARMTGHGDNIALLKKLQSEMGL